MIYWLSKAIFEKLLGWPPAQEVGERVAKEVNEYNRTNDKPRCDSCKGEKLVKDVTGSDGIFTSPHHFYRCKECGNAQDDDGDRRKSGWKELQKNRIAAFSHPYRYRIFTENQFSALVVLTLIAFGFGLYKLGWLIADLLR